MSQNQSGGITPSRRSVVKGAAWAVPAVAVAAAAPTVAASQGPLAFTGGACKLPGGSSDLFKGYVFELTGTNVLGPNPLNSITVISDVQINNQPVTAFRVVVKSTTPNSACTCPCTVPGATCENSYCTPDGSTQRILVYTDTQANSQNTSMTLTYTIYDCANNCAVTSSDTIDSGVRATPPSTSGGGNCNIVGAVPPPTITC